MVRTLLPALLLLTACQASTPPPAPAAPVAPAAAACPSLTDALLDLGSGVSLHIHCTGSGAPTVILESGHGVPSIDWADVQQDLSQLTRVCAYDRAGLGDSSRPASVPHTMPQMVQELHALLGRAGIPGPYVLVGHSLGGGNVRLFASQHPDEVAGMVLVDSSTAEQFGNVTDAEIAESRERVATDAEGVDFVAARIDFAPLTAPELSLGDKPLVVLSHGREDGPPGPPGSVERWDDGQKKLPGLSTNSARIVAEKSGHFIYTDQPRLFIASVRQVVAAARTHGRIDATALAPLAQEAPPAVDLDALEKTVFASFVAHDPKMLFELFAPRMRKAFPLENVAQFMTAVLGDVGPWHTSERIPGHGDEAHAGVWRVHAERDDRQMSVMVDGHKGISGFWVKRDEPPVARSDQPTALPIALPVRGEWTVLWGGDRPELNYHLEDPSQRRAADLAMARSDGKTFRTDGKTNADYLDYGQPVLAVADGTVVTAIDGVPDNVPGALDTYMAPGNTLIIQHGPKLFSVYAHLQQGSLKVRPGARVKRGSTLGLCGNSGNSSEPHLHFQLQDGPAFEKSWGIEAVFPEVKLTRDGKSSIASGYTFVKGDRIGAP